MTQNVLDGAIDLRAATAAFVVELTGISDAGDDQTVPDAGSAALVAAQPCDCPDRAGNKQEAVRVAELERREKLRQVSGERHAGQIVVAERRMAGVTGEEKLLVRGARDLALAVREASIFEP